MAGKIKAVEKGIKKATGKFLAEAEFKALKQQLRKESRNANKKLKAMERNGMEGLPAYQEMSDLNNNGRKRYSTAGKNSKKDVQAMRTELAKIKKFNNAETGGVKKSKNYLKRAAAVFGINYKNTKELIANSRVFWEIVSKLQQKYDNMKVEDSDDVVLKISAYLEDNPDAIDTQDPEAIMEAVMNKDTVRDSKNTSNTSGTFSRGGEPRR